VLDGNRQYIDISGNLVTVVKSRTETYKPPVIKLDGVAGGDGDEPDKPLYVSFRAFRENRRHVNVRVWDVTQEPVGTTVFLAEPPKLQRNQTPVCMLNVNLADAEEGRYSDTVMVPATDTTELCRKLAALPTVDGTLLCCFSLLLHHRLGIGCRRNSSYCDRQHNSDKNLRHISSAWLKEPRAPAFNSVMHHRYNSREHVINAVVAVTVKYFMM